MLDGSKQGKMKQEFNKKIYFNRKPQFCSSHECAGWSSFKFMTKRLTGPQGAQPSCCFAAFSGAPLLLTEKTASKTGLPCPCAPPELTKLLFSLRRQHFPPVAVGELRAALKPAHPPVPWTQHAASALGITPRTHLYCRVLCKHKEQLLHRERWC